MFVQVLIYLHMYMEMCTSEIVPHEEQNLRPPTGLVVGVIATGGASIVATGEVGGLLEFLNRRMR